MQTQTRAEGEECHVVIGVVLLQAKELPGVGHRRSKGARPSSTAILVF